jgi:copper resistance protein C
MRAFLTVLALLLIPFGAPTARAHAFLDHASPLVGSTVASAPHEVVLTFTQSLEPSFSTVTVTDPGGTDAAAGKAQVSGNTMRVGLKAGGAGTYRVHWHALSTDTHTTEGTFTFHVGK